MPVIETTLIEGYDAQTKARLMKGMARVVRSVMAAPPEGIVTVIREVAASSYARGGVSRVPGPPLPPAVDVVSAFVQAVAAGDRDKAASFLAPDFSAADRTGRPVGLDDLLSAGRRSHSRFDEALGDDAVTVFAQGTAEGAAGGGFIERYTLSGALIAAYACWGGD